MIVSEKAFFLNHGGTEDKVKSFEFKILYIHEYRAHNFFLYKSFVLYLKVQFTENTLFYFYF